jgi:hypothetical protein
MNTGYFQVSRKMKALAMKGLLYVLMKPGLETNNNFRLR